MNTTQNITVADAQEMLLTAQNETRNIMRSIDPDGAETDEQYDALMLEEELNLKTFYAMESFKYTSQGLEVHAGDTVPHAFIAGDRHGVKHCRVCNN